MSARISSRRNSTLAAIVVAVCLGAPDRALAGETIPYFKNPVVFDVGPYPYGLASGDIAVRCRTLFLVRIMLLAYVA